MNYTKGLYYKTLWTRNLRLMDRFRNTLVPCIVDHKHTSLLAYYRIRVSQMFL